jgi:hypothetical protein
LELIIELSYGTSEGYRKDGTIEEVKRKVYQLLVALLHWIPDAVWYGGTMLS